MWKLIITAVIALSIWLYLNPNMISEQLNNMGKQALNAAGQDKTISGFNNADKAVKNEAQNVLNKQQ